jgi:hypothetical protein
MIDSCIIMVVCAIRARDKAAVGVEYTMTFLVSSCMLCDQGA